MTPLTPAPSRLREKLGPDVQMGDIFTPERMASAKTAMQRAQEKFLRNIDDRLRSIQAFHKKRSWSDNNKAAASSHAYAIKSQSETLGYILMAQTALSLCNYTEKYPLGTQEGHTIIAKHLETMQLVLTKRIEGNGGQTGTALLQHLDMLISKFHSPS